MAEYRTRWGAITLDNCLEIHAKMEAEADRLLAEIRRIQDIRYKGFFRWLWDGIRGRGWEVRY